MKVWLKNQLEELGIQGIIVYIVAFCACTYTAIWLAQPVIGSISGIPSFIIVTMIYLLLLLVILVPVMRVAVFVGAILGAIVEGIFALYNHYKRA